MARLDNRLAGRDRRGFDDGRGALLPTPMPDFSGLIESFQRIPSTTYVTAGGAAMVAFLAGLAVARGVVRQILGMISLGVSVMAGIYVFQHRAEVFGSIGAGMSTDRLLMLSAGAGLLTYFLCRGIAHLLAGLGVLSLLGGLTGWKGGVLSLIPSGFLLWASALLLRLLGSVYGMENAAEVQKQGEKISGRLSAWLHHMSQQVDRSSLGSLAVRMDPFDMRARANLSRLLILWPDGRVWQQIAARGPQTAQALNHSEIIALGKDAKVRQAIERQDFAGLMQLPQIREAAANPELEPFLRGLALEQAMDAIVYQR